MSDEITAQQAARDAQGKHIAVALVGALILVFAARYAADAIITSMRPAPTVDTRAADEAAARAAQEQIDAEARAARKRIEEQLIADDAKRREQKKTEALRAREEAAAAQQAAEARKEEAFNKFYKPSAKCRTPADDASRIDCSNQYMRAREKFEKQYTPPESPAQ